MTDRRTVRVVGPGNVIVPGVLEKATSTEVRLRFPKVGVFTAATGAGKGSCSRWRIHPDDLAALAGDGLVPRADLDARILAALTAAPAEGDALGPGGVVRPAQPAALTSREILVAIGAKESSFTLVIGALARLRRAGVVREAKEAHGAKPRAWVKRWSLVERPA